MRPGAGRRPVGWEVQVFPEFSDLKQTVGGQKPSDVDELKQISKAEQTETETGPTAEPLIRFGGRCWSQSI